MLNFEINLAYFGFLLMSSKAKKQNKSSRLGKFMLNSIHLRNEG